MMSIKYVLCTVWIATPEQPNAFDICASMFESQLKICLHPSSLSGKARLMLEQSLFIDIMNMAITQCVSESGKSTFISLA